MPEFEIEVSAGSRDRKDVIVRQTIPPDMQRDAGAVTVQLGGRGLPGQIAGCGDLIFMLDELPAGATARATVVRSDRAPSVEYAQSPESVDIIVQGEHFTSYNFGEEYGKPFFGPVYGPHGTAVTRPLRPDIRDHPHHRGIFLAHGDVGGEEIWNEPEGKHGHCIQKGIRLIAGSVAGALIADNTWQDRQGQALMDDTRAVTIHVTPSNRRIMDVRLVLKATYGDVRLGATKEAGFLGIRMHPDIAVASGKGGRIENAYGGVGESECWSKPAHWCDYHGVVDGERVGIAILDHADNLRFPTRWHVRDYGLMAVNPWYWDGDHIIPAGEELVFRYRLIVHAGDTAQAGIAEQYIHYDVPPGVRFTA